MTAYCWAKELVHFGMVLIAVAAIPSAPLASVRTATGDRFQSDSVQAPASVDRFTGQASTQVPIIIPPGRPNATPQLSLAYSSGGGDGPFGFGWALPLGHIERSTRDGVPTCTGDFSTNEFVLSMSGGQSDLTYVGFAGLDTFRVKVDDGFIQGYLRPADNTWEFYDRSGIRYRFGWVASARVFTGADTLMDTGACAYTARWALTEVSDTYGNTVEIQYQKDGNALYPASILYGGNPGASPAIPHPFKVDFALSPRLEPQESHRLGLVQSLSYVIDQITVHWKSAPSSPNFQLLRAYTLNYEYVSGGGRARLVAVDTGDLPSRTFEYASDQLEFQGNQTFPVPMGQIQLRWTGDLGAGRVFSSTMDMNGDGIQDLVVAKTGTPEWVVSFGTPGGLSAAGITWTGVGQFPSWEVLRSTNVITPGMGGVRSTSYDTLDITGDGFPDYINATTTPWLVYPGGCTSATTCGFGPPVSWSAPLPYTEVVNEANFQYTTQFLIDLNGDGRLDLVSTGLQETDPWNVYLGVDNGFDLQPATFTAAGPIRKRYVGSLGSQSAVDTHDDLVDFNGDGLPDRISTTHGEVSDPNYIFTQTWKVYTVYDASGAVQAFVPWTTLLCPPYGTECPGVVPSGGTLGFALQVELNTGSGFAPPVYSPYPFTMGTLRHQTATGEVLQDLIDMNADGLPDAVIRDTEGSVAWRVSLNVGGGRLETEANEIYSSTVCCRTVRVRSSRVIPGVTDWIRQTVTDGTRLVKDILDWNGDGLPDLVTGGTIP